MDSSHSPRSDLNTLGVQTAPTPMPQVQQVNNENNMDIQLRHLNSEPSFSLYINQFYVVPIVAHPPPPSDAYPAPSALHFSYCSSTFTDTRLPGMLIPGTISDERTLGGTRNQTFEALRGTTLYGPHNNAGVLKLRVSG